MKIDDIKLKIIPDSRGKDTLAATLISGNFQASSSVPAGKSTGATEAVVLPPAQALDKISWLISQLKDQEFVSLEQFDGLLIVLDGTKNKSRLGGNLLLSLSMAFTRLLAKAGNLELFELISRLAGLGSQSSTSSSLSDLGVEDLRLRPEGTTSGEAKLPFCFFNLIEGGVHAQNSLPFQEYLLIPQVSSPKQSLEIVTKAISLLGEKMIKEYGQQKQGDEGGYSILSKDPLVGLQVLQETIRQNDFTSEESLRATVRGVLSKSKIGLDVAASAFYQNGYYQVGGKRMTSDELSSYYQLLTANYHPLSIEDPFDEEDWQGFSEITAKIGEKVWIIGDDLLTTNVARIKKAYEKQAVNAVLIKPNQIGTITETIQAVNLAKSYGWKIIVSHRSGETMDTFIADLAVGVGADGLKSGNPLQKERLVKYQRLVEIESRIKNYE